MPARNARQPASSLRLRTAELAARFMREGGLGLARARDKAAMQLQVDLRPGNPALPSDNEVQHALHTQLQLFSPPQRQSALASKRQAALEAMDFLRHFSPRLAGPVLDGSAQEHDPVILHLHPEAAEDVPLFLEDQRLPAQLRSARILLADGPATLPCWHLVVDDTDFHLWVLPALALRQPPLQSASPPQPMERASAARLRRLLD